MSSTINDRTGLVLAYAISPERGSEQGAGFFLSCAMSQVASNLLIVTQQKHVDAIRKVPALSNAVVIAHEPFGRFRSVKKKLPAGTQIYYVLWQLSAVPLVRRLHKQFHIDIGHHATFAVDWMPSALQFVPMLNWVWGPVGGSASSRPSEWRWLGIKGTVRSLIRQLIVTGCRAIFGRMASRRASLTICQNEQTFAALSTATRKVVLPNVFVEVGASKVVYPEQRVRLPKHHLLAAGELKTYKFWALAIQSLVELPECYTLTVAGSGPDKKRLQDMVKVAGLESRVHFIGQLPRSQLLQLMEKYQVLVHPSSQEQAGWVVAEAVESGMIPVVVERSGPAFIVANSCGVIVPRSRSRDQVTKFAEGIQAAGDVTPRRGIWTVDEQILRFRDLLRSAAGS